MEDVQALTASKPSLNLVPAFAREVSITEDWPLCLASTVPGHTTEWGMSPRLPIVLRSYGFAMQATPAHGLAERVFVLLILGSVAALWFS